MAKGPTDRLLTQLNQTQLAQKDNPVYQVIKQLIQRIKDLESSIGGSSSTTNIFNETLVQQLILGSDESSDEGSIIPGPSGQKGADGTTGAQGPPFPSFIPIDADQPEDVLPIPGPQGIQGPTGNTGPVGPTAVAFIPADEIYPDDLCPIPGPAGVSIGWTLIEARVMSGQNQEDFINLSIYSEILVICRAITKSVSTTLGIRVSTDNGATFLNSSGDYVSFNSAGQETNLTSIAVHITSASAARTGANLLSGFNLNNTVKNTFGYNSAIEGLATNTSPYNAIRVFPISAATLNAGTIYVLGR